LPGVPNIDPNGITTNEFRSVRGVLPVPMVSAGRRGPREGSAHLCPGEGDDDAEEKWSCPRAARPHGISPLDRLVPVDVSSFWGPPARCALPRCRRCSVPPKHDIPGRRGIPTNHSGWSLVHFQRGALRAPGATTNIQSSKTEIEVLTEREVATHCVLSSHVLLDCRRSRGEVDHITYHKACRGQRDSAWARQ